jgi:hypothetical protein
MKWFLVSQKISKDVKIFFDFRILFIAKFG